MARAPRGNGPRDSLKINHGSNDPEEGETSNDNEVGDDGSIGRPSFKASVTSTSKDHVTINCGGQRHETYWSTLKKLPDTRLSWLCEPNARQRTDYDPERNEYFFDRHPMVFAAILNYYRTGKLHKPSDVCGPLFEEELNFWGIDETQIEACCWLNYREHRDAKDALKNIEFYENDEESDEDSDDINGNFIERMQFSHQTRWQKLKPKLWKLLDDPYSSRNAKILAVLSLILILISICVFCLETMRPDTNLTYTREIRISNGTTNSERAPKEGLRIIDYICNAFFTIEFFLHYAVCPNSKLFFQNFMNLIDLLALIPFYINIALESLIQAASVENGTSTNNSTTATPNNTNNVIPYSIPASLLTFSEVIRFFRLVRLFRIIKLSKHLTGLKILYHTLRSSWKELLLLVIFVSIQVLFFATLVFYTEKGVDKNKFYSIPEGFWWAIATMTTVGYGDIVPKSTLGKVVGSVCAIFGVLTIALPVPIIVNNFFLYYNHAQAQAKLPKKVKIKAFDTTLENELDTRHQDGSMQGGVQNGSVDSNASTRLSYTRGKRVSPVNTSTSRRHRYRSNHNGNPKRVINPPATLQAYIDLINAANKESRKDSLIIEPTVQCIDGIQEDTNDLYEMEILAPIPENTTEINGTLPVQPFLGTGSDT